MAKYIMYFIIIAFLCFYDEAADARNKKGGKSKMILTSSAFKEGGMIPSKYTCDGENISPSVSWENFPEGTKSFAIICDDPDAPAGTWVHWVIFNIPAKTRSLPANVSPEKELNDGTLQGLNDFRKIGYGGPCPPSGVHRYFFKIYALDVVLELSAGATKAQLLKAMENHILAQAKIMGRYQR
ncbi:MAG: YbhB/YbcL family Raf kinase inhibitor-like protein [Spirochaetes bacterium]|nr:YbhB/YbcL family Raf kinase inhibitor-like protein [Spirochaetota bacterium]